MPFITHDGHRSFYRTIGSGPPVILLHGHLLSSQCWLDGGFAETFAGDHMVVLVDALGHGESDKPGDPAAYRLREQAGRIVALMDALQIETADLIGHSMGGWTGAGIVKHFPGRLRSLTLGGWDPVKGVEAAFPPGFNGPLYFDQVLELAKAMVPRLVAWVTREDEPGLRASWDALAEMDGLAEALLSKGPPPLFWCGRDDIRGGHMQAFADRHGLPMIWTAGNHNSVVYEHAREGARAVRAALDARREAERAGF
ncbi:alpha/beta fold hydrolase [Labrys neptuniae]